MGAIPVSTFVYLWISLALCIVLPILFLIFIGRKMPVRSKIILTGVICFVVFVILLERFIHSLVFLEESPISNNAVYYVIYGCVTAGFFECAAKFVGLKFMIKEPTSPGFAVQFGLGYGAAEALLLGAMPLASNLASAMQINKLGYDKFIETMSSQGATDSAIEAFKENVNMLYDNNLTCLLSGVERLAAMVLQIVLTIFIFQAVKQGSSKKEYAFVAIAFLMHALFDLPAAMYQKAIITDIFTIEIILLIEAVIAGVFGYLLYKKNVKEFGQPVNAQSIYNA